ncbi:hypothetical protein TNCV_3926291 [Trichonephila clavipes]|nr:hypothetical protein TNCV_3926291 [Trichonephila clavipes]
MSFMIVTSHGAIYRFESPLKDSMEQSTVFESPLKDPMEPSTVSESPLKEPIVSKSPMVSKSPDPPVKKAHVKKIHSVIHRSSRSKERWHEEKEERRNEKRWHEEPRPRDPRLYKRPPFRPPYPRHPFKPRGFQRPPYAQQLMPTSQENAQVFSTAKVWPCCVLEPVVSR